MNQDSPSSTSLQIARRLLARERADGEAEPQEAVAALQRTCSRVLENLCEVMGEGGCEALLARALARTGAGHPALNDIRRQGAGIHLDGLAASVEVHGVAAVTTGIEALLAALVETLGRLIGEDMAMRLVDIESQPPSGNTEVS